MFFVIATQNPVEFRGTYPLPEAQMDRFAMQFTLGYVDAAEEVAILSAQEHRHPLDSIRPCATVAEVLIIKDAVTRVRVSDELKRYIVDIVRATRDAPSAYAGRRPARLARADASGAGAGADRRRDFVAPEQIQRTGGAGARPPACARAAGALRRRQLAGGGRWDREQASRSRINAPMTRFAYSVLRRTWALNRWLRQRFTVAGLLVISAGWSGAIIGVDTERSMSYQAFTLLLAALAVSLPFAWLFRPGLVIERDLPRLATAGTRLAYRIVVRNDSAAVQRGLIVRDNLADPRPSYAQFKSAVDADWKLMRRPTLFDIWRRLIAANGSAAIGEVEFGMLPPGQAIELASAFTPKRRGVLHFDRLTLARPDPFNLIRANADYSAPARLLVLPQCFALPQLMMPGARRYQHGGVALATSVGDSEEFVSLRDYRPGDPLQRMHWKSFARLGYPVVKEYQDEFFERHALVLDTFAGGGGDDAFEDAVAVAASFVATVDTRECLLDLMFVGNEAYCFTAGRGQMQALQLLEVLAVVTRQAAGGFSALADSVLASRSVLSSVILVLLAWDDARRDLVSRLQAGGLQVLALVVSEAPGEVAGRAPWLVVLESGKIQQSLSALGS